MAARAAIRATAALLVCRHGRTAAIAGAGFEPGLVETVEVPPVAHGEPTRLHFNYNGNPISPWHDLPFAPSGDETALLTFVCEIPLGTTEKMEIHKSLERNPVIQDKFKDGSPRYYKYGASIVNYGAIAQTWEDPDVPDPDTGLGGDNDPIDVLQLNARPCRRGAVQRVRVLGALALVDGGETDWKLLVVDVDDDSDATIASWRDVADVPTTRVDEVRDWFRLYKTAEGKAENRYAFDGRAVDAAHALRVARLTHEHWRFLVAGHTSCTFEKEACWAPQVETPTAGQTEL